RAWRFVGLILRRVGPLAVEVHPVTSTILTRVTLSPDPTVLPSSGRLGLRDAEALVRAVVHQCVDFGGLVENRVHSQLRAALAHTGVDVVAEHHDLLAGAAAL